MFNECEAFTFFLFIIDCLKLSLLNPAVPEIVTVFKMWVSLVECGMR